MSVRGRPGSVLAALVREPVVQLLLAGALVFVVARVLAAAPAAIAAPSAAAAGAPGNTATQPETRIVMDAAVRERVRADLADELGSEPSAEMVQAALEHWLQGEVLFREGLRLGLDVDDGVVRDRVRAKMLDVLVAKAVPAEPTATELEAFYRTHRARYDVPQQVDFVHVFVQGGDAAARARAERLLSDIHDGADGDALGDTFSGGRTFRRRKLPDVAEVFGEAFRSQLETQAEESWQLAASRHGWHLVRLDRRTAARAVELDEVRARVEEDVREMRRRDAIAAGMAALRTRYQVDAR